MKIIIETFVTIIFLTIVVMLTTQIIGSQVSINNANSFHLNAVQAIEESNFDTAVITAYQAKAEEWGYELEVIVNHQVEKQCASCNYSWEDEEELQCPICGSSNLYMNYISRGGEVILNYKVEVAILGIAEDGKLEAYAR